MELDLAQQRQQAHSLLDGLPDEKFQVVHNLLEVLAERDTLTLSQSLASAPWEDEDLSPETMAALERANASLDRGEVVPHETVLREFGL